MKFFDCIIQSIRSPLLTQLPNEEDTRKFSGILPIHFLITEQRRTC